MAWGGAHRGNTFGRRRFGTPVDPVVEEEVFEEDYDELTDEDLELIEELENEDEDFLDADNNY